MIIHIELSSQIRAKASQPASRIEWEGECRLQALVRFLASRWGEPFQRFILDDEGRLRPTILLSLNDEQITWDENPPLPDGVRINLLSPIAGGASIFPAPSIILPMGE